jgi:hypothetical protein
LEQIDAVRGQRLDISTEDLTEMEKTKECKLSEEQLDEVTGGDWAFITYGGTTYTCIQLEDNDTFYNYFERGGTNDCPHYSPDRPDVFGRSCRYCEWRSGIRYKY